MPTISGTHGKVTWPNHYVSHCYSWDMDIEAETYEYTNWSDWDAVSKGWRLYTEGLKGFSGSYECYQDEVPAGAVSKSQKSIWSTDTSLVEITLFVDVTEGNAWVGCALLTGMNPVAPIDDMQTVSIDWQGALKLRTETNAGITTSTTS